VRLKGYADCIHRLFSFALFSTCVSCCIRIRVDYSLFPAFVQLANAKIITIKWQYNGPGGGLGVDAHTIFLFPYAIWRERVETSRAHASAGVATERAQARSMLTAPPLVSADADM
jgi:hypothetical protein